MTEDGGTTWTDVSAGLPERWVTSLAVHPTLPRTAYVTISGYRWDEPIAHVFRTDDAGATWTTRSGGLPEAPANVVLFDPADPDRLYLGSDAGAFYTDDGGAGWQLLGPGLPAAPVLDLALHAPTGALVAGTYGRGMYRFDLAQLPTAAEPSAPTAGLTLRATPNPARGYITVKYELDRPASVRLAAYDARGRRVAVLAEGERAAGRHDVGWDLGRLSAGVYALRLEAGGRTATTRVTRVR